MKVSEAFLRKVLTNSQILIVLLAYMICQKYDPSVPIHAICFRLTLPGRKQVVFYDFNSSIHRLPDFIINKPTCTMSYALKRNRKEVKQISNGLQTTTLYTSFPQ